MTNYESFFGVCLLIANGLFGADTGKIKSVSIMEGDSVTLNTNTEIQSNDQILWMFGARDTRIAEIHRQIVYLSDSNVTFGDRLKIDSKTGSLTIRNITTKHSGLYKLTIIISSGTSYMRFSVTVYAHLPTPLITMKSTLNQNSSSSLSSSVPNCVLDCSVFNISNVSLSWYKENSLFSTIRVSNLNNSIYLHLECLDDSYSCVVAYSFTHKTAHPNNTQHCHKCSEAVQRSHLILLIVNVAFVVLGIFAILMCCHSRKCTQKGKHVLSEAVMIQEEEMHYADTTSRHRLQSTDVIAEYHPVYSSIRN